MNLYYEGDTTHYCQPLYKCMIRRCWEECIRQSDFYRRKKDVDIFNRCANYFKDKRNWVQLSHVTSKLVFGGLRPGKTQAGLLSYRDELIHVASIGILHRQRTTKALIRLHRCACWSAFLLFAYGIKQVFSWCGWVEPEQNKTYKMIWALKKNSDQPKPFHTYNKETKTNQTEQMHTTKALIRLISSGWSESSRYTLIIWSGLTLITLVPFRGTRHKKIKCGNIFWERYTIKVKIKKLIF